MSNTETTQEAKSQAPKSNLVKALTLTSFALLMSAFVAYRSGAFDQFFSGDVAEAQNYEADGAMPLDSPDVKKADSLRESPAMLPTSKSMILIDKTSLKHLNTDTSKKSNKKKSPPAKKSKLDMTIMGSSKSAPVFTEPIKDSTNY
ncbi:MAG: hypothetical protein ACJ75J_01910 [Cytophagaceae bacterium]